jgi:hypothetical protein
LITDLHQLISQIRKKDSRHLLLQTKLCLGFWPPDHAPQKMIQAFIKLTLSCWELVKLAKALGTFEILPQPLSLEVRFLYLSIGGL